MVALLAEIAARTDDEHPYIGDKALRELRAEFDGLPAGAGPRERWELHLRIGMEELRLGNNERAIAELGAAGSLLSELRGQIQAGEANQTLFQLALAHLRLAEAQNCVAHHTIESCLLPIQGKGIHVQQEPSRKAIVLLSQLLRFAPEHISARWLLNIAYMTIGGWPGQVPKEHLIPPETFASEESFPRFRDAAPRLGLNSFNLSGGVIVDDFDGDGYLDIITSSFHPAGELLYFRNNGDGSFTERSAEAGFAGITGGLNLIQADYDNDGDLDFLVLRGAWLRAAGRHPNSLLQNDGRGAFTDVTFEAGLAEPSYPTQTAAWADYDLDGDLDLYIGNETSPSIQSPCQLFRNNGNRTFTDVAATAGVENFRFTKGVVWDDYDGDRHPDIYVSNLDGENRLYRNLGDGTFRDVAPELGVTLPLRSFPVWFWDFDNDGALDIFVSSYCAPLYHVAASYIGVPSEAEPLRLYRGDGRGGFEEVAARRNLRRILLPMGANFGDIDGDGFPDFYLGTGYPGFEGLMPNVLYRNRRGTGFSDVTTAGGFGHLQKGHGIAFADLDNDGDQDVFAQMGGAYRADGFWNALFENPGFGNNHLTVRLVGTRSNRSAIGARLRLEVLEEGSRRAIHARVTSGGSFGANPLRREIGLGKARRVELLEVFWPASGIRQTFRELPANRFIEIREGEEGYRTLELERVRFR
jgi:hypothetical protein